MHSLLLRVLLHCMSLIMVFFRDEVKLICIQELPRVQARRELRVHSSQVPIIFMQLLLFHRRVIIIYSNHIVRVLIISVTAPNIDSSFGYSLLIICWDSIMVACSDIGRCWSCFLLLECKILIIFYYLFQVIAVVKMSNARRIVLFIIK
jgi:hypothetical protein